MTDFRRTRRPAISAALLLVLLGSCGYLAIVTGDGTSTSTLLGLTGDAPDSCQGERFSIRVTVQAGRA